MTDEQRLAEIRQRADKATAGPWFLMQDGFSNKPPANCPTVYATDDELRYIAFFRDVSIGDAATPNLANATFTAHAREDVPYLLDRVANLEQQLQQAKSDHEAEFKRAQAALDQRDHWRDRAGELERLVGAYRAAWNRSTNMHKGAIANRQLRALFAAVPEASAG